MRLTFEFRCTTIVYPLYVYIYDKYEFQLNILNTIKTRSNGTVAYSLFEYASVFFFFAIEERSIANNVTGRRRQPESTGTQT